MLWVLEKGTAYTLVFAEGNRGKFPKGGDNSAQIKGQEIVKEGIGGRSLLRQGQSMLNVMKGKVSTAWEVVYMIRKKSGMQGVLRDEAGKFLKGICTQ